MKRQIFLLALLAGICHVHAATYFCSPTGNGNGSSYASPCSFADGLNLLQAGGDTLYLLGGQYDLGNTKLQYKQGNVLRNMVISGYPGQKAILDFRTTPYGTRGLEIASTCAYIHIKNLTLRYSGKNNLHNSANNCRFENLDIYGSSDTGCQMKNAGNCLIINVDSHDNFDYEHYGTNGADFGGNADGFADKQHSAASNTYIGCRAWNNSDDGWDFFDRTTGDQKTTVIENCICYQNGPAEYDMRNHPRYQTDKAWFDKINGTTITNRYGQEQVVTLEHYPCHGNGNGFKLGGNYSTHNVLVHHCLSVANTVRGYDQNNNAGTMYIYNNSAYLNGPDYGFGTNGYGTLHIRNCVSYRSVGANSFACANIPANDHNTWNSGFACSATDFQSLDTTQILQPRQADGSLPIMTLMHLTAASGLIDTGVDVGLTYMGSSPDLGWDEVYNEEVHNGKENPIEPEDPTGNDNVRSNGRKVAYITTIGAAEDELLLNYLRQNDSLAVYVEDANNAKIDYSSYEVLILSPKPSSGASGFAALKGYRKPMLVLKPFLFKNTAWNWGTPQNTQDLAILVSDTLHPLFTGISFGGSQRLPLFSKCQTNAVTGMSAWTQTDGFTSLATPESHPSYCSLAMFPAGVSCNGTTLQEPLIMLGISEYSTSALTDAGLKLIENAICHLAGLPLDINYHTALCDTTSRQQQAVKTLENGQIVILRDGKRYTITGLLIK